MDLISVVVPLYNKEMYIGECLESLIKQSYKNLEIIVVNDNSTDNSYGICVDYANMDSRIKIINNTENKGLSEARNIGIENSTGKYLAFVDSDDYIVEHYIENLYNAIIDYNADVAQCNYYVIDDNDIIMGNYKEEKISARIFSGREMIKNIYNSLCLPTTLVWTKLYKRELFYTPVDYCKNDNNLEGYIRFPKGMLHEDEAFSYKIYDLCKTVVYINERLYCYRYVSDSITHRAFSIERLDNLKHIEERLKIFKNKKDIGLYNLTLRRYYYELILALGNCKRYLPLSDTTQRLLKKKITLALRLLRRVDRFEDKTKFRSKLIIIKCALIKEFKV